MFRFTKRSAFVVFFCFVSWHVSVASDFNIPESSCGKVFTPEALIDHLKQKEMQMHQVISQMSQPFSHGTDSKSWESMLQFGAMKHDMTEDGQKTGALCLSDLKKPDGLLASYGFAVREKWEWLQIRSRKSVVKRYSEVNPFFRGWLGPIKRYALSMAASEYVKNKASASDAYPVYLIFDGQNEIQGVYRRPSVIPSEYWVNKEISLEYLRVALVPFRSIDTFKRSYSQIATRNILVLPIEIFELNGL